jgi:hypothetical protein
MSGGAVKADPRCAKETLKECNLRRGCGAREVLTHRAGRRNRWLEQGPEGGAARAGADGATFPQADAGNRQEGRGERRARPAGHRGKPL